MKSFIQGKIKVLVIIHVVLALLLGAGFVHAGKKVHLVISGIGLVYLPRIVAQEKGFFAQEGLDYQVTDVPGGSKAAAALLGGSSDVVELAYFHALKAARKGFDVVAFACPLNQWPHAYMMRPETLKEKGITVNSTIDEKILAMKGLKIGCSSPGSGTDLIPRAFLRNRGIDPNTEVRVIPFGKMEAGMAALENGKIDVYSWVTPTPEIVEKKGIGVIIFNMAKGEVPEFDGYMYGSYFTTRKFMKEHPEVILAFTKAILRGMDYFRTDKQGTLDVMAKYFPQIDREILEASYQNLLEIIPKTLFLTKAGWEGNIALLFADDPPEEKAKMAFEKVSTNEFVEKAMKELGK